MDELLSGRRRGLLASLTRACLWLASLPFGLGVRLRNLAYSRGWLRVVRASAPVISIGNLTVGGTGKTPCVEYVAGYLNARDCRVCILSRGYGSESGPNDEALVLEENLPEVPHLQGADRAALAAVACEELESEILVLDDGFQHRRLARDLDIVLIDATRPWGYRHLLPRGLLREPARSMGRAHAALITRCDQVTPEEVEDILWRIGSVAPTAVIAETVHRPVALVNSDNNVREPGDLQGRDVAMVCGIGNPTAFRHTLESLGARVVDQRIYPDHHAYTSQDVEALTLWAQSLGEEVLVLTTQKDLVKLRLTSLGGRPVWALRIGLAFLSGEERLLALFDPVLARMERG